MCECLNCPFEKSEGPILYQIHVSVHPHSSFSGFLKACKEIGVEGIIMKNHGIGEVKWDLFTSSTVKQQFFDEMNSIADQLTDKGFKVVRKKVETVPWNPLIESFPNGYWETHYHHPRLPYLTFGSLVSPMASEIGVSSKRDNSKSFITLRSNDLEVHNKMKPILEERFPNSVKAITEYALFDSNRGHDDSWINIWKI